MSAIISNKFYDEHSVFLPENLLREARRQKNKKECKVPAVCLLDPDGDLAEYLLSKKKSSKNEYWACYHSSLYTFCENDLEIGIIPYVVGASYAVLVAEQLFVSGCKLLISVTSAGIINRHSSDKRFALITSAIRDEGTSYHYLPPDQSSHLNKDIKSSLSLFQSKNECPFFEATSWTTDAPYRETASAIKNMMQLNVSCVEMEASALYALAQVKGYKIICFAHLTNSMAQKKGDFEKGNEFGSIDTLYLITHVLNILCTEKVN
jgi:uridine phosphorylase